MLLSEKNICTKVKLSLLNHNIFIWSVITFDLNLIFLTAVVFTPVRKTRNRLLTEPLCPATHKKPRKNMYV